MDAANRTARWAGALYLSTAVIDPLRLVYAYRALIVHGNATATATKILESERLFRLGLVADLLSGVIFVIVAFLLYRLLSHLGKELAFLMVALVVASVTIGFVGVAFDLEAVIVFRGSDFAGVFEQSQRNAFGMMFLDLAQRATTVNEVFWGVWLFPLGSLVIRSRFLPRVLGVLLMVNGAAYLAVSILSILQPSQEGLVFRVAMPAFFGELWLMLWLVIKGVKTEPAIGLEPQSHTPA